MAAWSVRPEHVVHPKLSKPGHGRSVTEGAMSSSVIVEVEPAGQRSVTLGRVAIDGSLCPATEHRANETLRLAVGARPIGTGEEMADLELAAGDRVKC